MKRFSGRRILSRTRIWLDMVRALAAGLLLNVGCQKHCPAVQIAEIPVGVPFRAPPPIEPVDSSCLFALPAEIDVSNVNQAARCLGVVITGSKGVVDQQASQLRGYAALTS